ncbi:MAG: hypothetical protein ACU84J_09895 [Gammaproteobacteria bacterium]
MLEFVEKKSSAAQLLVNPCLSEQAVGVGSVFQLLPNGRLWLKSASDDVLSDYQLICRNRSKKASNISVIDTLSPWINPVGFSHCGGWSGNKLTCKDSENGDDLFFCAIAKMKRPEARREIQLSTSVKMRGMADKGQIKALTEAASNELDQIADFIKPEIDLCRKAYDNYRPITLKWTVYASGEVSQPTINEPISDVDFADCISDVITGFEYPSFPKDIKAVYQF